MPTLKTDDDKRAADEAITRASVRATAFCHGPGGGYSFAAIARRLEYANEVSRALGVNTEEEGYRRGYYDGYLEAVRVLATEVPRKRFLDRVCSFINRQLTDWKLNARRDKRVVEPPQFE